MVPDVGVGLHTHFLFGKSGGARERVERLLGASIPARLGSKKATVALALSVVIVAVFAGIALAQPAASKMSEQCSVRSDCARLSGALLREVSVFFYA